MTLPSKQPNAFQMAWRNHWLRLIVFIAGFCALFILVEQIREVLADFTIAFLVAYLANPMLKWLEGKKTRRGIGIIFVILIFASVLVILGALSAAVASQFLDLLTTLPEQIKSFNKVTEQPIHWLSKLGVPGLENVQAKATAVAQEYIVNLGNNIGPILTSAVNSSDKVFSGLRSIGGVLAQLMLVMLMSIYLMLDYDKINTSLLRICPAPWQERVLEISKLVGISVGGYLRGQIMIATCIGTMVWIGLSIINIPSAGAIGFLAGMFNIVPYLGPIIGATPALLLALPGGPIKMLLVIVVFVVAGQLEGHLLSPMILGKTTDLHPITVLLSILIGLALMGLTGAVIAVPIVALGKLMLEKYYYGSSIYSDGP